MLGWQESTLKIHILDFYDEFDNLVRPYQIDLLFLGWPNSKLG